MKTGATRILMVCMGNICRSPTAQAVLHQQLRQGGLDALVSVDSAGTHGWHEGAPPDARSQHHAALRGYDLSMLRSRPLEPADYERFDLLLAMDWDNLEHLQSECPPAHRTKLRRLMEFAPDAATPVVPDPYAGGPAGFERVLDLIEAACTGLVLHLRTRLQRLP